LLDHFVKHEIVKSPVDGFWEEDVLTDFIEPEVQRSCSAILLCLWCI